jgi:TolA-binding protein
LLKYPLYSVLFILIILLTACSKDEESTIFERAEKLLGDGDYVLALETYNHLADKYPESVYAPTSKYKVGLIHNLYMGNQQRALDTYLSLILMYPESRDIALARKDIAEIYSKNGDHRRAIGEYQWFIENSTGTERDDFRYRIAMEYQKLSDFKQAIIEIQEILKDSPSTPIAPKLYYQIATNQYLDGNLNEAIDIYDRLVFLYPDNHLSLEARLGKAVAMEEQDRLIEAKEILMSLEAVYPNKDAIKVRLSWVNKRIKEGPSRRRR